MSPPHARRPKVLFFAEDVTLAHFARMAALASTLDAREFDVVLACGEQFRGLLPKDLPRLVPLRSTLTAEFNRRLADGEPVFSRQTLERYLTEDLALISQERPDVVVGDFRLSLSISAELAGVASVAVSNGGWSPFSTLRFPVPELAVVRWLGLPAARRIVSLVGPLFLERHFAPFNEVRRSTGLTPVDSLQEFYTRGDLTLYPDTPTLAPTRGLPASHRYIGPVVWEPAVPLPSWWHELPADRPIIYLSSGSSGAVSLPSVALEALADLPVTVVMASGTATISSVPANAHVAPYLPGIAVAHRASLVISNGGSGTIYQALSGGVPVLGIPSNADQYLCMEALLATGAGSLIRAGQLSAVAVRTEVNRMLGGTFAPAAQAQQREFAAFDSGALFAQAVRDLIAQRSAPHESRSGRPAQKKGNLQATPAILH